LRLTIVCNPNSPSGTSAPLEDVAERAGVSLSTVSFVLNKKRGKSISPETSKRVWAVAQELKRELEASGRYRVEMTRTSDVFIPLEHRVDYAQAHGAALFVSMHADALSDHGTRGASVYTLAATASDAQTAQLAQRENSADRFADPRFRALPPAVTQILASLVRRETRIGSVHLARDLVGQLHRDLPMLPNPARHAGFVVLKAADIPSVLVEMGFMSNPEDEAALRQPDHRARVAAAMRRAVDAYFAASDHVTHMAV